jgi:hypothetical protein
MVLAATVARATVLAPHGAVLAKGAVNSNDVTPGVLGFLVVAGMGIALFFLLRSMNRQFRKLPPATEPPGKDHGGPGAAASGNGAGQSGPAKPSNRS